MHEKREPVFADLAVHVREHSAGVGGHGGQERLQRKVVSKEPESSVSTHLSLHLFFLDYETVGKVARARLARSKDYVRLSLRSQVCSPFEPLRTQQ